MAKPARVTHGRDDLLPLAFRRESPFGTCVAVHLPGADSINPFALLEMLHPEERELCRSMRGARLVEWIGGRHASRLARARMACADAPTLMGANGAPDAAGARISLSHTQTLAVALASPDFGYAVGVDVEAIVADRHGDELLAERILSPAEACNVDIVQRLSIKEAVYKAVFVLTGAHLPLRDIVVTRYGDGFLVGVPAAEVEAISSSVEGHYLSLARARQAA
jgi:4'-phosphopantetheinyl transferase EntD